MKALLIASLLIPTFAMADSAPQKKEFRTFVVVERVTPDTKLEVKLPHDEKTLEAKAGQKFEIPANFIRKDGFPLVIQMVQKGNSFLPCAIDIDGLSQFDRRYLCQAANGHVAQVEVRVYTNLNGGDRLAPQQMVAKK